MAVIRDATLDDAGAVFELLAARSRVAFGISEVELGLVEAAFRNPAGTERWVADDGGEVVGYAALSSTQDVVHAAVDPGVGDTLLARAEAAARQRGFGHIAITAVREDEPLWALVGRHGFEHERDVLRMWRTLDGDLPEPRFPQGVTVRTYRDGDGERVHALLDAAYAGWDDNYAVRPHEDWLAAMVGDPEFDAGLWFLAERDGEPVGCALHWREHRGSGWVKDLVVAEGERGRGLGAALLHQAFRAYATRGAERVGLKVDSTNPTGAIALYEKLGFVTDRRLGIWLKRL